jgi:hypothetical protein
MAPRIKLISILPAYPGTLDKLSTHQRYALPPSTPSSKLPRMNQLNPEFWLADVINRIADHPINRIDELLPWNWRALNTAAKAA